MAHDEIVTGPLEVYTAPVGTAFPAVDEVPSGDWVLIGTSGSQNHARSGVQITHTFETAQPEQAGQSESGYSFTVAQDMQIRVELLDLTLEQYAQAIGYNAVTETAAGPGITGTKVLGLSVSVRQSELRALLVRGKSPYDSRQPAQYEIPRCHEVGSPDLIFQIGKPAGISLRFVALRDPDAASETELFGRLVAKTADMTGAAPPSFNPGPSISGTVAVGETLTGNDGTIANGSVTARQWLRGGVAIDGATSATYTLVLADLGENIGYRVTATGDGGITQADATPVGPVVGEEATTITAIAANGWQATDTDVVDLSLRRFDVDYDGFDETGAAATHTVQRVLTKRVREVYPNQDTFTSDQVAIDDYVYAGATSTGITNNSTAVSPKPIATWGMMDRELVGNSIDYEIIPFHRDAQSAQQVACVEVQATDGINTTAWQTVSTPSLSTYCDGRPVEVFAGTLDITSLDDDATITLRGRVKPWLGVTASIRDSETETEVRFTNRYFYKNTARAAAPNLIYVSSTGNDTTGVVSTDAATAAATPALTIGGAIGRLRTELGTASVNTLSGAQIRVVDGVDMGSVAFNSDFRLDGAAIKITAAPGVSRSTANITWASGDNIRLHTATNTGAVTSQNGLIFEEVTITRTADVLLRGQSGRDLLAQFRNVTIDFSNVAASSGMMNLSDIAYFGLTFSNYVSGFAYMSAGDIIIARGLVGDLGGRAMTGYNVIGCTITDGRIQYSQSQRGALVYQNEFIDPPGVSPTIALSTSAAGEEMEVAVVQNLLPMLGTTNVANLRISGDNDDGNVTHAVVHHNTTPGDDIYGRWNLFYDESTTARTHEYISFKGNLGCQMNTKGDVHAEDGTRTGNFQFYHGVGCTGNFTEDVDAAGGVGVSLRQDYGGFNTVIAGGDPLYTTDNAVSVVSGSPVAGSTGGDYTLQSDSPARDLFIKHLLKYDFTGAERPTSGTIDAGVYA